MTDMSNFFNGGNSPYPVGPPDGYMGMTQTSPSTYLADGGLYNATQNSSTWSMPTSPDAVFTTTPGGLPATYAPGYAPAMNTNAAATSPYSPGGVSGSNQLNPMADSYNPFAGQGAGSVAAPQNTNIVPTPAVSAPVGQGQWGDWLSGSSGAAAPGGIDFSGIQPSFSYSVDGGTSGGVNTSQSFSGLSDPARSQALGLLSGFGQGGGNIADLIDQWTQRALNQYRFTGDDAARIMNEAANRGAARGILGGTEQDYLRSNLFGQALNQLQTQQQGVINQAVGLKSDALQNILSLLRDSASTGTGVTYGNDNRFSYSQSPDDYQIILDLIRAGYTG